MTIEPGDTADKEVERIARAMCRMDGIEPDAAAIDYCPPQALRGFYLPPPPHPAWQSYRGLARAAIDELRSKSTSLAPPEYRGTDAAWFAELIDIAYRIVMPRMQIDLNEGNRRKLVRQLRNHLKVLPEEYS